MSNHPYAFEIYLVNVKTMRTVAQIFVAFSEQLNFKIVETCLVYSAKLQFENPRYDRVMLKSRMLKTPKNLK